MAEEDLIFGKNRHFFGGIEPSNMLAFTAVLSGNKPKITATLPNDTIINGQTLCTVAGAVIRRKTTDYPRDEFDGDKVAVITNSSVFVDNSATPGGTYFYAAFPYTEQGVYNRNKSNRAVVNEPKPMIKFEAASKYNPSSQSLSVDITATLPAGITGAIIRKSTTGYPADENDGQAFKTITSSGVYTDNSVSEGITYYYAAFPYTSTGAFNRDTEKNRTSVTPKKFEYIYGFDLNMNDNNPKTRVTYPSDVDNKNFAAAKMNMGGAFSYGGWPSKAGEKFMPKPCMLTYAGKVDHYLDPNDYTKRENGGASSVSSTSFGGNAMMEWPKIYVKRWVTGNTYHFRCSDMKMDSDYECWCNYDRQNHEIPHFYTPIYFGSNISGQMRSISGQSNFVSQTADTEIAGAKKNGADWYTEVLADRLLINDLLVMMGKSTDTQTVYGAGRTNSGNSSAVNSGTMNTRGLFWGSSNGTDGVKVFGMEHWWGNIWRRIAGWMLVDGTQKVKITRGTKDGTSVSDYNTTGSGYKTVAGATPTGSSGGYISGCKVEPYGRIPFQANGSSSTYEADVLYYSNSGTRYAIVGGYWDDDLSAGAFSSHLYFAPSHSAPHYGAALSCKPLAAA